MRDSCFACGGMLLFVSLADEMIMHPAVRGGRVFGLRFPAICPVPIRRMHTAKAKGLHKKTRAIGKRGALLFAILLSCTIENSKAMTKTALR